MLLNEFLKEHKKVEEQAGEIAELKAALKNISARLIHLAKGWAELFRCFSMSKLVPPRGSGGGGVTRARRGSGRKSNRPLAKFFVMGFAAVPNLPDAIRYAPNETKMSCRGRQ